MESPIGEMNFDLISIVADRAKSYNMAHAPTVALAQREAMFALVERRDQLLKRGY
jgi:hypothetical protein